MRRCAILAAFLLLAAAPLHAQIVRPTTYIGSMFEVRQHLKTAKFPRTVVVATDGTGDFLTFAAAVTYVTAQSPGAGTPWRIIVYSGAVNLTTSPLPVFTTLWTASGIFNEESSLSLGAAVSLAAETTLTLSGVTSTTVGASTVATNIRGLPRFLDAQGLTAALPATCTAGQVFLDTTAASPRSCFCRATDTWSCIQAQIKSATAPYACAAGVAGDEYFDTTTPTPCWCSGSAWTPVVAAADCT